MQLFLSALLLFFMVAVVSAAPHPIDLAENAATIESDGELPLAKVDPEIDYPALDISEYAVMMQSARFGEQSATVNPDTSPSEYTAGGSKTNLESYADIISRISSMHNNVYQSNNPPYERLFEGYLITFIQSGIRYSLNRLKNKVTNLLNLQQSTTAVPIPTTSSTSITTPITSPPTNTIPSTITEMTASPGLEVSTSTTVSTTLSSVTSPSTTETSISTQQATTTGITDIDVVDTTTPSTTTLMVDTTTPAVDSNTTSTPTTSGVDSTTTSTTTFVVDTTTTSRTSPLEEDITLQSTTTTLTSTTSGEDSTSTSTSIPSTNTQVMDSSTPSTTTQVVDSTTTSTTTTPVSLTTTPSNTTLVLDTTSTSTTTTPGEDITSSPTTTPSTITLVEDRTTTSTTTQVADTTSTSTTIISGEDVTPPSTTTPSNTTLVVDTTSTSTTTSGIDTNSSSTTPPVVVTSPPSTTTVVLDSTTTSTTQQVVDTTTPSTTTTVLVTTKPSLDTTTTSTTTPAVATTTQTSNTPLVDTTIPSTSTSAVDTTTPTTDTSPSSISTTVDTTLPSIITPLLVDTTTSSTTSSPVNTKPSTIIPEAETTTKSTISTGIDATTEPSTKKCSSELFSNSGWFTSPNYPSDYNNNMDCSWLINATDSIVLTFQSFNTESCCDFVTVYDGYTTNVSSLLLNISGLIIPSPVISSRGQVLVTFTSDGNKVSSGFNVSYALESETSSPATTTSTAITSTTVTYPDFTRPTNPELILGNCHTILPNDMGTFSSPYYPQNYTNKIKCPWLITASGRITITFHQFRTQSPYDTVTIYDGPRTSNKRILVASGDSIPPPITPNSNEVLIWFITDGSVTDIGFNASYAPAEATEPYYCGENITDVSSGFISSPNFPNSYPANSRCIWILQMAEGTRIQFHFTNFSTGPDDTVQVFNLETCTTPLIRKSGNVSSACGFVSSGNWLKINFTSGESTSKFYRGFRASFTTDHGCGGTFNGTDQRTIMSPGYNINGTFTYNCEWKLRVNQGQKLNFSMSELTGTAPNMNYFDNGYQLAYGQPTSSFFVVSSTSQVSLSMISSYWAANCLSTCNYEPCINSVCLPGNDHKWKASHTSTTGPTYGCYGSMDTDTRTVSSPGFPTTYKLRSLQCSWKITEPVSKRIQLVFPVPLNLFQYDNLKINNPPNVLTISGGSIDLKPIEIGSYETTLTFSTNSWVDNASLYTGWSINWNAV